MTPVYPSEKKVSEATFSPTLFTEARARMPLIAAPAAVSRATFSFMEISAERPAWGAASRRASRSSTVGEPGYPA